MNKGNLEDADDIEEPLNPTVVMNSDNPDNVKMFMLSKNQMDYKTRQQRMMDCMDGNITLCLGKEICFINNYRNLKETQKNRVEKLMHDFLADNKPQPKKEDVNG